MSAAPRPVPSNNAPRYRGCIRVGFSTALRIAGLDPGATEGRLHGHDQHDARIVGPTDLLSALRTSHDTHQDLGQPTGPTSASPPLRPTPAKRP